MSRPSIVPTTVPSFYSPTVALASVIVLVLWGTALAEPEYPQNIVVIMVDDLDWTELPFFNPPVQWELAAGVPQVAGNPSTGELRNRLPALNRMAARFYAGVASSDQRGLGQFHAQDPLKAYQVKPVDFASGDEEGTFFQLDTPTDNYCNDRTVDPADPEPPDSKSPCDSARDIYKNSGGLNKIAGDRDANPNKAGIVFGRFYSTSAVCSPARASFMTGRHPTRVGVPRFDRPLNGTEVTIAEFLKQGCVDAGEPLCVKDPPDDGPPVVEPCECYMPSVSGSDCGGHECTCADAACYRTAIVGKWHLGLKTKQHWAPWQQGFDEFIGMHGGNRAQFSRRDLQCSPAMRTETWRCYNDSDGEFVVSGSSRVPCSGELPTTCDLGQSCRTDIDEYGLYLGALASPGTDKCKRVGSPPAQEDVDCCQPRGTGNGKWKGWKGGSYRFKYKLAFQNAVGGLVAGRDTRSSQSADFPCNDVGEVKSTQCLYATRWMRDYARNFIERHALDAPPNGPTPFFLFVGFTAPHVPYSAPLRTIEHYQAPRGTLDEARIRAPGGRATYWAMLEELDEAVGAIISKLEEVPAGAAAAPIGRTVVMFTSDHGRPGSLYGNPKLRGGKSNVLEGGIRVGMLIRGDGLFGRTSTLFTDDTTVGSFTDMFQTIAAAAGYDDLGGTSSTADTAFDGERIPFVKTCTTPGQGCGDDESDCPGGDPNDCKTYNLDGVNLVPFLKDPTTPPARDLVFAHYAADTRTVASVKGYFDDPSFEVGTTCTADASVSCSSNADCTGLNPETCDDNRFATHVCGYSKAVTVPVCDGDTSVVCNTNADCTDFDPMTCGSRTVRQVRGASCAVCDPAVEDDCAERNIVCDVLGGVCVNSAEKTACEQDPPDASCNVDQLSRCRKNSDCPGAGRSCSSMAHVECDQCLPTAWKYREPGGKKDSDGALYDLTTNSEEDPKDSDGSGGTNGRLNCFESSPASTGIGASQKCLALIASDWRNNCVGDRDGPHCELGAPGVTLSSNECEAEPPP